MRQHLNEARAAEFDVVLVHHRLKLGIDFLVRD